MKLHFFLALSLFLGLLLSSQSLSAQEEEMKEISFLTWAPTGGPQTLWRDAAGGLEAAAAMYNANGGLSGRKLNIITLATNENSPNFFKDITRELKETTPYGLVGGPVSRQAKEFGEYVNTLGVPWFGPWSDQNRLYQAAGSNGPFAILPTWQEELPALLNYVQSHFTTGEKGTVYLLYYDAESEQEMATWARQEAANRGLELKRAPVEASFTNWPYIAEHMDGAAAVIIYLSQGDTAAALKAIKAKMPKALYLTGALNPPNSNLVLLSGGAWEGVIFPSILRPSQEIPKAFENLIKSYGLPGLMVSYQTYLGFSQGQILARAVSLSLRQGEVNLTQGLYALENFNTLFANPLTFQPGEHYAPEGFFYLAQAYGKGQWRPAPIAMAPLTAAPTAEITATETSAAEAPLPKAE